MTNQIINSKQLVFMHRVRDEKLYQLINEEYDRPEYANTRTINLFIDLYSIFRRYYGNSYKMETHNEIAVDVLNMCISYRRFFARNFGVHCIVYLIDSNNCNDLNRKMYQNYNNGYINSIVSNNMITDLIYDNRNILSTLCPYLEDIMYITTNYESAVVIYNIILKNLSLNNNFPNIVLSKDMYMYQLLGLELDIRILRPKKYHNEDISYMINHINVVDTYITERTNKNFNSIINPGLLSYLMCITRLPERNIKSLMSITKAAQRLELLIKRNIIMNKRNTDITRLSTLLCENDENPIPNITIDFRFKAIDVLFQNDIYNTDPGEVKYDGMVNLYDPESIKQINNDYFKDNPIDIINV